MFEIIVLQVSVINLNLTWQVSRLTDKLCFVSKVYFGVKIPAVSTVQLNVKGLRSQARQKCLMALIKYLL